MGATKSNALIFLTLIVPLVTCQIDDAWITRIEEVPQNVTFNCDSAIEGQVVPEGAYPERWMLPDLTNIGPEDNTDRIRVINDSYTLEVDYAGVDDFGLYHCMMRYEPVNETTLEWFLVKKGLNVRGPYFDDLWEKYQNGTIIGLSACLGFLVASMLVWFVATHTWEEPLGWDMEQPSRFVEDEYTNLAYEVEHNDAENNSAAAAEEMSKTADDDKAAEAIEHTTEL